MKKVIKRVGVISVVLLVLLVLATTLLPLLVDKRQRAFQPLSNETLNIVFSHEGSDSVESADVVREDSVSTGADTPAVHAHDASQTDESGAERIAPKSV